MYKILRIVIAVWAAGIMSISGAYAQNEVELSRAVYVERVAENGERQIAPAKDLRKGDKVVLLVEWQAPHAKKALTVSSPVPGSLAFQRSSFDDQSVSIDGGRNWGRIGSLRIRDSYGERLATVEDVTHLRWQIPAGMADARRGRITYSAIVR